MSSGERVTERELQQAVVECARWLGWLVYHTYDSRRSAPGFPDLCMARGRRLLFVELKTAKGRVSGEQQQWLDALATTGSGEVRVWRPADWSSGLIERALR